jgi:hypothetical protein
VRTASQLADEIASDVLPPLPDSRWLSSRVSEQPGRLDQQHHGRDQISPLLGGLLLLALPNLANSFATGRLYLEGELRELEERRRRRAIVARIAAVVVVLMGIAAWMMLA